MSDMVCALIKSEATILNEFNSMLIYLNRAKLNLNHKSISKSTVGNSQTNGKLSMSKTSLRQYYKISSNNDNKTRVIRGSIMLYISAYLPDG